MEHTANGGHVRYIKPLQEDKILTSVVKKRQDEEIRLVVEVVSAVVVVEVVVKEGFCWEYLVQSRRE